MSSLFATEFAAAAGLLDEQFGETVTLMRGVAATAGVMAVRMSPDAEVLQLDPAATEIAEAVWLVIKSDYVISSVVATPRAGDTITDAAGEVWEVLPADGIPAARSPYDGTRWVLCTRKVE